MLDTDFMLLGFFQNTQTKVTFNPIAALLEKLHQISSALKVKSEAVIGQFLLPFNLICMAMTP